MKTVESGPIPHSASVASRLQRRPDCRLRITVMYIDNLLAGTPVFNSHVNITSSTLVDGWTFRILIFFALECDCFAWTTKESKDSTPSHRNSDNIQRQKWKKFPHEDWLEGVIQPRIRPAQRCATVSTLEFRSCARFGSYQSSPTRALHPTLQFLLDRAARRDRKS